MRKPQRFFERIQILALQILDQRQFKDGPVRISEDHWDLRQPQHLGGARAAFTRDQLEVGSFLPHDQWLDDALFLDRIRKLPKRFLRKLLARLEWAGPDVAQGDAADNVPAAVELAGPGGMTAAEPGAGFGAGGTFPRRAPSPRPKTGFTMTQSVEAAEKLAQGAKTKGLAVLN